MSVCRYVRAGPGGRPGLEGGGHVVGGGVRRHGAPRARPRHLPAGVAGLRGAGPAAAGGLAPLRHGGEVRPRVHWVRGPDKNSFGCGVRNMTGARVIRLNGCCPANILNCPKHPHFFSLVSRVFHRVFFSI